jgi:hypothetical protein
MWHPINAAVKAIENEGFLWVPNERRIQPPDDWVDLQYVPDDPHGIFMDSYHYTGEILATMGAKTEVGSLSQRYSS